MYSYATVQLLIISSDISSTRTCAFFVERPVQSSSCGLGQQRPAPHGRRRGHSPRPLCVWPAPPGVPLLGGRLERGLRRADEPPRQCELAECACVRSLGPPEHAARPPQAGGEGELLRAFFIVVSFHFSHDSLSGSIVPFHRVD